MDKMGSKQAQDRAFMGLKSFLVGGWWSPSDYSVCPCPLDQFYAYLRQTGQFVRYSSLRRIMPVYLGGQGRGARQLNCKRNI